MKKLVILFICFTVFQSGFSLECYKCENCDESKPDTWEKINCGVYGVPIPLKLTWACLTIDFKNKTTSQEETVRKCVLAKNHDGNLTFDCPIDIGEIKSCKICDTDLCT